VFNVVFVTTDDFSDGVTVYWLRFNFFYPQLESLAYLRKSETKVVLVVVMVVVII